MKNSIQIRNAIKEYAATNDFAITELATKLKVAPSTVTRWANGTAETIRETHWLKLQKLIKDYLPEGLKPRRTCVLSSYNTDIPNWEGNEVSSTEAKYLQVAINNNPLLKPEEPHYVPVITSAQAKGWEAEYDTITDAVDLSDCDRVIFYGDDIKADWVAVRVNGDSMGGELPHGSTALVDMGTPYPKSGKRILAKLKTGDLIIKRYFRRDNTIRLESDGHGQRWEWHIKTDDSPIEWMRPIKKILIDED